MGKDHSLIGIIICAGISTLLTLSTSAVHSLNFEEDVLNGSPTHVGNVTEVDAHSKMFVTFRELTFDDGVTVDWCGDTQGIEAGYWYEFWVRGDKVLHYNRLTDEEVKGDKE